MPRLTVLPIEGWMNPVIIDDDENMVLIDCPLAENYADLLKSAKEKMVDLARLTHVILTHQDGDHVASIHQLRADFPGISVIASAIEREHLEKRRKPIRQTQCEEELRNATGERKKELENAIAMYEALKPIHVDIVVEDGQVLDICGGIEIVASPGHMPGHISVYIREIKALVTGDSMIMADGELQTPNPVYTLDMDESVRTIEKYMRYDIEQVVCYHGGIFKGDCRAAMAKVVADYRKV